MKRSAPSGGSSFPTTCRPVPPICTLSVSPGLRCTYRHLLWVVTRPVRIRVPASVPLGTGQMNWPAIFSAAQKAGIKHYFIEDESPTSMEQIPNGLAYLKSLKW